MRDHDPPSTHPNALGPVRHTKLHFTSTFMGKSQIGKPTTGYGVG